MQSGRRPLTEGGGGLLDGGGGGGFCGSGLGWGGVEEGCGAYSWLPADGGGGHVAAVGR